MTQPRTPGTDQPQHPTPAAALVPTRLEIDSPAFAQLSGDLLGSGLGVRFRAKGDSMSPLVRHGDTLLVQPLPPVGLRAGDVVLFRSEGGYTVVHRVVRRAGDGLLIQGDNLARPDGVVPPGRIYGKVVSVERGGAHISLSAPPMRVLGWLAVLQSRSGLHRRCWWRALRRLARGLPPFARYLA